MADGEGEVEVQCLGVRNPVEDCGSAASECAQAFRTKLEEVRDQGGADKVKLEHQAHVMAPRGGAAKQKGGETIPTVEQVPLLRRQHEKHTHGNIFGGTPMDCNSQPAAHKVLASAFNLRHELAALEAKSVAGTATAADIRTLPILKETISENKQLRKHAATLGDAKAKAELLRRCTMAEEGNLRYPMSFFAKNVVHSEAPGKSGGGGIGAVFAYDCVCVVAAAAAVAVHNGGRRTPPSRSMWSRLSISPLQKKTGGGIGAVGPGGDQCGALQFRAQLNTCLPFALWRDVGTEPVQWQYQGHFRFNRFAHLDEFEAILTWDLGIPEKDLKARNEDEELPPAIAGLKKEGKTVYETMHSPSQVRAWTCDGFVV